MKKETIIRLHGDFEQRVYKDTGTGTEFWFARDLQTLLGYSQWRSFAAVIEKAKTSCKNSGNDPADHFARTRKMVDLGSGAKRQIEFWMLDPRYWSFAMKAETIVNGR